jgi:hypothetical protein
MARTLADGQWPTEPQVIHSLNRPESWRATGLTRLESTETQCPSPLPTRLGLEIFERTTSPGDDFGNLVRSSESITMKVPAPGTKQ